MDIFHTRVNYTSPTHSLPCPPQKKVRERAVADSGVSPRVNRDYYDSMGRFDGLALINAVGDLAELLGRRNSIDEFLQDLVTTLAEHMDADVCSVYLYDVEQDLLVLRATVGLNPNLVGKVRLGSGEGLTGTAFLNNSPIVELAATDSRLNKAIPDLGEEKYPAFVGVPIKRNNLGIGVLTIQYVDPTAIDDQITRTLRAIASHLAATLENAAALYELHEDRSAISHPAPGALEALSSGLLNGTSASGGIAIGMLEYLDERMDTGDTDVVRSLPEAIEMSAHQLQELQQQVDQTLSDVAQMIFSSHLLMLRDDSFVGEMIRLADAGSEPVSAVQEVVDDFSRRFAAIPDPRFQEKVQDVQDLGHRIVRNLQDREQRKGDYRGHVVVAHEIFPSELVKLYLQNAEGLAFASGGATSHVAILAQSLDLPLVATGDPRLFAIPTGTRVVIDAEDGKVVIAPSGEILEAYRARLRARRRADTDADGAQIAPEVTTRDGHRVTILANVNLVKDARAAARIGAHGVGLYRSEFPFLIRNGFPTEDEQLAVYQRVIEEMAGKPVTFRTLDLGGDKLLSTQVGREDNPFLGFRGVRFLLAHPEILRDQLRAMLRAGATHDLGIQFPMVSSIEEFREARNHVSEVLGELKREGIPHCSAPRLGVMIELPSIIETSEELGQEADFFSVGTNDLIMYLLAADRTNHRVSALYRSIHPALLRVLDRLMRAARATNTPVSVCGASAADPAMAIFYMGIGITQLSVDTAHLGSIATLVAAVSREEAAETARTMLATADRDELARIAGELRARYGTTAS